VRPSEDSYSQLAAELAAAQVDVIVTVALRATKAVHETTTTIPTVMIVANDPVAAGIAASLAQPGGNITGLASLSAQLSGKRLELLKTTVPSASRVGVIADSFAPDKVLDIEQAHSAAQMLGMELRLLEVRSPEELDGAFALGAEWGANALTVLDGDLPFRHRIHVSELAAGYQLPAIYAGKAYVAAGGLISYGPSAPAMFGRAAVFVDKILKGAHPSDLPIEQPAKFELVLNRKTARDLGLIFPEVILRTATEVLD
jgi:putative ABC transport system substrate-binding protein